MPAFYTHKYFAQEVFKELPNNIKKKINYGYYFLFAQGFDILFYNIGKKKYLCNLGHKFHRYQTRAFFENTLEELNHNNNEILYSFFYGMLTHYILDSTFHPYIFYKTGLYNKKDKSTYPNNGGHTRLENQLDKYFYSKENTILYHKAKFYKTYDNIILPQNDIINSLNNIFQKTFQEKNIGYYYFKSLNHWRFVQKHFKDDYLGFKKYLYKFIHLFYHKKLEYYSTNIDDISLNDLNIKHKTWYNPTDKSLAYNYSVEKLFNIAKEKYLNIINKLNNERGKFPIPNISYRTGIDLDHNQKMQYFESKENI